MKNKKKKVPSSALLFSEPADYSLQFAEGADPDALPEAFNMEAYSGKIIKNHWLWGDLAIDIEGLSFPQKKYPILEQHDIDKKVGVAPKPSLEDMSVSFSQIELLDNDTALAVAKNMKKKFPYQASISVKPSLIEELAEGESTEVNGYTMKGPGTVFRKALFKEASVCVFGYDPRTSVTPLSEEDEYEVEVLSLSEDKKTQKKTKPIKTNGGSCMFEHLKEENPELYAQIMTALADKDKNITSLTTERDDLTGQVTSLTDQVTSLTDENKNLSDAGKENEKRLAKLELSEKARLDAEAKTARTEKADEIIDASFAEHKIGSTVQKRIRKYLGFSEFVAEDGTLDETAFSAFVDTEIKGWKTDLGDLGTGKQTVLGLGDNHNDADAMTEEKAESVADDLVALAYPNKDK